jgi:hypothetical protein
MHKRVHKRTQRERERERERIAGPIVHKPQWYWYLTNSELCELYNDAICSNEINHVQLMSQLTRSSYQGDVEVHDPLPKLQ